MHILSTAAETIEWILKQRKVWSAEEKETVLMNFLRLNLIDDYNDNMNNTDISDQLRNQYCMDYWICNKKWWWAIFMWAIGVAATNAWIIYDTRYAIEKAKAESTLPPQRAAMGDWMVNNRESVRRCLVCNVNLCPNCELEFHGVNISNTRQLLGK